MFASGLASELKKKRVEVNKNRDMTEQEQNFREGLKVHVDNSKINLEKYMHRKSGGGDSDDPDKGERQRERTEEHGGRDKKSVSKTNCEFHQAVLERENVFLQEQLEGEKREALIEKIISLESAYLNIQPPKYALYAYAGEEISYGMYCSEAGIVDLGDGYLMETEEDTLYLNAAMPVRTEDEYREFLDTIIHEVRHKFQDTVREEPEKYSDVSTVAQRYLAYSTQEYEKDARTNDGYWNNGLEQDSRAFARSRTEQYMAYSIDELLQSKKAPEKIALHQILMEAGEKFPDGKRAPVTVSQTFYGKGFSEFSKNAKKEILKKYKGGNKKMGQMTAGTDFSEQAQMEAAKAYGSVITSIQNFSENVVIHFVERVKTHPYKQLENVGNVFIKYYNDELPQEVKNAISDWISSDNSFVASLKRQEEGEEDASISAARKTENQILEQVSGSFKHIEPIKISLPISIDKERIMSDAVYVENLSKQLAEIKDQWLDRFQKMSDQNSLYANMMPMVAATFTNVESGYHAVYKDIMDVSEEFRDARNVVVGRDINKTMDVKGDIKNRLASFKQSRKNRH